MRPQTPDFRDGDKFQKEKRVAKSAKSAKLIFSLHNDAYRTC